jgi:integrase
MSSTQGIIERRADSWAYRFAYRDDIGGRHHIRRQGFRTKADAQRALVAHLQDVNIGRGATNPNITTTEYLTQWIETYERSQSRKITTTVTTGYHVRSYLIPRLGTIRLSKLTAHTIAGIYADLLENGRTGLSGRTGALSPKTVRNIAGTFHKALEDAVKRGYLSRNPTDGVDLPRWERPEIMPYDETEVMAFLEYAAKDGDPTTALWRLMFATGIRRGEMLGLRWSDVDLVAGEIMIERSRVEVRDHTGGHISSPKTRAGRRSIPIDPDTTTSLALLKNAHDAAADVLGSRPFALVATDLDGTPIGTRAMTRRFQVIAQAAGLRVIRLHDTRHTHATIMLDNGVPIHTMSQRLGHSRPSTTLDVYAAFMPAAGRTAATTWAMVTDRAGKDAQQTP